MRPNSTCGIVDKLFDILVVKMCEFILVGCNITENQDTNHQAPTDGHMLHLWSGVWDQVYFNPRATVPAEMAHRE